MTNRDALTNPPRRLPDLALPAVRDGAPTPLRARGRKAPLLLLLHGPGCPDCADYLRRVGERLPDLREWDGRPLLILEEPAGNDDGAIDRVVDPEGRAAAALDVEAPAVVVADQWGEVHLAAVAGDEHRFPTPEELVGWARYLAVHCPECEGEAL